jgi:aspartate racemase
MRGEAGRQEKAIASEAVRALWARGVDGIILGCTEIPLLLKEKFNALDIINPAQLLAEAAIRYAMKGFP